MRTLSEGRHQHRTRPGSLERCGRDQLDCLHECPLDVPRHLGEISSAWTRGKNQPRRLPVLQDSFFYSNMRLGAGGCLEEKRQLLVEEQKSCRARARKLSRETNRRRKALEERRKQWDMQEQQLKQQALEQRRQRFQDATERFQRAHLLSSQRCRRSFRINVPNIEDALQQIQGHLSSSSQKSSFLSSNSNLSRSCTPSPKPQAVPQSCHCHALSAVEAHSKLLQEQSMTCFRNSQLTTDNRMTQQKPQDCGPQGILDWWDSESFSSKDSLQNEHPCHNIKKLECSHLSFHHDSEKPHPGSADVGIQVNIPHKEAEEIKVRWSSTRTGNPKVPWRECSSSRTRKETVIQPQSATDMSPIANTHAKIIIPCPPPRMEWRNNSEGLFSPYTHQVIRTNQNVLYTPLLPSYTCPISDGNMKGTPSSGLQETPGCSRRRGMFYDESGLRLDCSQSDEGITPLWQRVRDVLLTKEATTKHRRHSKESGEIVSKPSVEQSRHAPDPRNRRFPQLSQDLTDWCDSESFSSKDSLENEDLCHSIKKSQYSYLSFPIDSKKRHPDPIDVGVKVSLLHEVAEDTNLPWGSTRTDSSQVLWREQSSSRTRNGNVTRPQCTTNMSPISITNRRIIMPRPPPRKELVGEKMTSITETSYGMNHPSISCKPVLTGEQTPKNNSKGLLSPYSHHVIRTDQHDLDTPLPPSYTCPISGGNIKGRPSSGPQETQGCSRRRGMICDEKCLCLDSSPTDEEIFHLWQGIRSALNTKEATTRHRRETTESGRVVRKPSLEQSRQAPNSENKRFPHLSQGSPDWCDSQSFSSKDSLENEDLSHSIKKTQCSHLSFPLDSERPNPGLSRQNDVYEKAQNCLFQ